MAYGQCINRAECGRWGELREDGQCTVCNPYVFRFEKQTRDTLEGEFLGLQELYKDDQLVDTLKNLRANGASYHQLQKWLDNGEDRGITHMDIKRAINEKLPKSNRKRKQMRLHPYATVPACPVPGCTEPYVHLHGKQTYDPARETILPVRKPGKPREPRIAIHKRNPARAARTIVDNLEPAMVKELMQNLMTITYG